MVSWQLTGATGTFTAAVGGNTQLIAPLFSNIEQLIGGAGDDVFVLTNTGNRYSRALMAAQATTACPTAAPTTNGSWAACPAMAVR